MVRKRSHLDLDSKMPVKDSMKSKSDHQKDLERASMSDKDNSDYSSSKATKVWSRELRNRFVIANNKRSLRFTNDVRSGRHVRSCRMAMTSHQHYTLSQSDDDEDDNMFTPRTSSRRMRLQKRRRISPEPVLSREKRSRNVVINGHMSKSSRDEEENVEEGAEGIRRSTRQRKLKYENYSDSWIVGAQTLRGYPMYGSSYNNDPDMDIKNEDEEEDEEERLKVTGETDELDTEDGGEPRKIVETRRSDHRRTIEKERADGAREIDQTEQSGPVQVNSSDESESSSEEVEERPRVRERVAERKYHLRQTKPTVERFQAHVDQPLRRSSRTLHSMLNPVRRRRRRPSSTSTSSSSDDQRFERKMNKSTKGRSRCLPQWKGDPREKAALEKAGAVGGGMPEASGRLADVDPISLDTSIRFSDVGGLQAHVRCLQEMVVFPMMYSEVFAKYHVKPPKGVLFHGPPGTGKTLIARALANECSQGERKVTFFMRKGADCLSKWVGESERQLRLLFEQAHQSRPSIIFFDELDGLAPVRSAKQDQIHASIVSTLLALMDGLDDRGEIVVIGATNRIDAIDPALRRPGRFDRELLFPLPANKERLEILKIHMSKWEHAPSVHTLNHLAEVSAGYCGSDLRALCSEAVIQALRRRYPQIYKSSRKLLLNPDNVQVLKRDFEVAQRSIVPASFRSAPVFGRKLPIYLEPLLGSSLAYLLTHVKSVFPCGFVKRNRSVRMVKSPRLLVLGQRKATGLVTSALLHRMEHCPVHTLDLATLYGETSKSPEEATVHVLNEVRRNIPSILYIPGITEWWSTVGATVRAVFKSLLHQLDPSLPILLIATAVLDIPNELHPLFSTYRNEVYKIEPPTLKQKEEFFRPLFFLVAMRVPTPPKQKGPLEELPVAPPPSPPKLTEVQLKVIYDKEENTLRELRIFLRQICAKLARNKQFFMFSKPVDIKEVPDYLNIIKEPMDLETMMTKIDLHDYTCAQDFLNDIELICKNALEYNPDRDPADKLIRHRACYLRDTAYALIKAEMDSDFEDNCREIRNARKSRAATVDKFAPEFIRAQAQPPQTDHVNVENKNNATDTTGGSPSVPNNVSNSSSDLSTRNSVKNNVKLLLQSDFKRKRRRSTWSRGLIQSKRGKIKLSSSGEARKDSGSLKIKKEEEISLGDDGVVSEVELATLTKVKQRNSETIVSERRRGRPPKSLERLNSSVENNRKTFPQQQEEIMDVTEDVLLDLENLAQSTPLKKKKKSTDLNPQEVMVNGVEGSSSEDEEQDNSSQEDFKDTGSQNDEALNASDCSVNETSMNEGRKQIIIIHKPALTKILSETVNVTKNISSLETLIDLYAQLRQVIARYFKVLDRSKLPQELEVELKRFVSRCKDEVQDVDESFQTTIHESSFI